MNSKLVCLGLFLVGMCLLQSAEVGAQNHRVRLVHGDYDCSCSYYCPSYGIKGGACYDNDYWGWGTNTPQYCCTPSYMDYDRPDMFENGLYWRRRK